MARGVARTKTFLDDQDRRSFIEIISGIVSEGGWLLHAFCLMPNHYHLLCETPRGGLARWMRQLNGRYTQRFNVRHKRVGHLWQGRYKAILVESGAYFLECGRYIHLNPNRSRLTRPAERYPWSSYRNYVMSGVPRCDSVATEKTLSSFGGSSQRYRAFVESGNGEAPVSPFERAFAGLVLGGDAFIQRIRKITAMIPPNAEQPSLTRMQEGGLATPEEIEALVHEVFGDEAPRRQQRLLLYTLRKFSSLGPSAIARRHNRSPAAVTLAVRDLDREALYNLELSDKLEDFRMAALDMAAGTAPSKKTKN